MSGAQVPAPAWLVLAMTTSRTTLLPFPRLIGSLTLSRSTQTRWIFFLKYELTCSCSYVNFSPPSLHKYPDLCVSCFVYTKAYTGCVLILEQTNIYTHISVQVNSTYSGQRFVFRFDFLSLLRKEDGGWVTNWTPSAASLILYLRCIYSTFTWINPNLHLCIPFFTWALFMQ